MFYVLFIFDFVLGYSGDLFCFVVFYLFLGYYLVFVFLFGFWYYFLVLFLLGFGVLFYKFIFYVLVLGNAVVWELESWVVLDLLFVFGFVLLDLEF